jgi:hypothetical protein
VYLVCVRVFGRWDKSAGVDGAFGVWSLGRAGGFHVILFINCYILYLFLFDNPVSNVRGNARVKPRLTSSSAFRKGQAAISVKLHQSRLSSERPIQLLRHIFTSCLLTDDQDPCVSRHSTHHQPVCQPVHDTILWRSLLSMRYITPTTVSKS